MHENDLEYISMKMDVGSFTLKEMLFVSHESGFVVYHTKRDLIFYFSYCRTNGVYVFCYI